MPRKKTVHPKPLQSFNLEDGTQVDIVDENCWPIGRGQHSARDFEYRRLGPIMNNLVDIYLMSKGPQEVERILSSPTNFSNHIIFLEGILDKNKVDDTNARKLWYEKVKNRFSIYISALENKSS